MLYNSCYLFEQSSVAGSFRPVEVKRHKRNGWTEKYDRSGLRLTVAEGEFEGQRYSLPEWRETLNREAYRYKDKTIFEKLPYYHRLIRPELVTPDFATVMWRKVG